MGELKENQASQPVDGPQECAVEARPAASDPALNFTGDEAGETADKGPSKRTLQRQRHAAGQIHLSFWIAEDDLVWKLEALRLLDPAVSDQPEKVAAAARTLLETLRIDDVAP